jgi:hypothetical protein
MKRLVGIAFLIAATGTQASHWVPVATGPEHDMAGLYVDVDSIKGIFPVRTVSEKVLNSYSEQKLSLVEMNCAANTWRAVKVIVRAPHGAVLRSANFPRAKSEPIARDPLQNLARRIVCNIHKGKASKTRHLVP